MPTACQNLISNIFTHKKKGSRYSFLGNAACLKILPYGTVSKRDQSWVFLGRTDAKAETVVLWPPHAKSWLIEKDSDSLGARGEGDDRGWDGWMASLTRWTWVSVNSGSWWWIERSGVLWFMGSQRVGHDWATDLIWSVLRIDPGRLRAEVLGRSDRTGKNRW